MILDSTVRKLQVVLGEAHTTNPCAVVASWFDSGTTPSGGPSLSSTNGTTAVDVVGAPPSGYIRQVNELTVFNADTVDHAVTVRFNDNGTTYTIIKQTISPGQSLTYSKALNWNVPSFSGLTESSGSWTPIDASGDGLSLTITDAKWTRQGNIVDAAFRLAYPATASGTPATIGGLPFTSANRQGHPVTALLNNASLNLNAWVNTNATTFGLYVSGSFSLTANSSLSGKGLIGECKYFIV